MIEANILVLIKTSSSSRTFAGKLLNIYENENDKLRKDQKKRIQVQNEPENLPVDSYLDEDNLPSMLALEGVEEVKLQPEETIA